MTAYLLRKQITAFVQQGTRERLLCLDGGTVLIPISGPVPNGNLVQADCEGAMVWVFERDLDEGCEMIQIAAAAYLRAPRCSG